MELKVKSYMESNGHPSIPEYQAMDQHRWETRDPIHSIFREQSYLSLSSGLSGSFNTLNSLNKLSRLCRYTSSPHQRIAFLFTRGLGKGLNTFPA